MMTRSCKWVLIKRQPGDGEISNITNAKKTMLKTMSPEGGVEQTVITTCFRKWVPIRAARNNLGLNQSGARNITSARKMILKTTMPEGGGGEQPVVTTRSRKWVLIRAGNNDLGKSKTRGKPANISATKEGSTLAKDTNLDKKEASHATRMSPTEEIPGTVDKCVIKFGLNIFHTANDVQEAVLGMTEHCLTTLHERDKKTGDDNKDNRGDNSIGEENGKDKFANGEDEGEDDGNDDNGNGKPPTVVGVKTAGGIIQLVKYWGFQGGGPLKVGVNQLVDIPSVGKPCLTAS
jgi:hypothetical protein